MYLLEPGYVALDVVALPRRLDHVGGKSSLAEGATRADLLEAAGECDLVTVREEKPAASMLDQFREPPRALAITGTRVRPLRPPPVRAARPFSRLKRPTKTKTCCVPGPRT